MVIWSVIPAYNTIENHRRLLEYLLSVGSNDSTVEAWNSIMWYSCYVCCLVLASSSRCISIVFCCSFITWLCPSTIPRSFFSSLKLLFTETLCTELLRVCWVLGVDVLGLLWFYSLLSSYSILLLRESFSCYIFLATCRPQSIFFCRRVRSFDSLSSLTLLLDSASTNRSRRLIPLDICY